MILCWMATTISVEKSRRKQRLKHKDSFGKEKLNLMKFVLYLIRHCPKYFEQLSRFEPNLPKLD